MNKILFAFTLIFAFAFVACSSSKKTKNNIPTATLTNTYWKLTQANDRPVTTPDNSRDVHIRFMIDGNRLQGYAGCNGLGGNYVLSGNNGIRISAITTKMYCDRMVTENFLTDAITKADNYRVTGEKLSLYQGKKLLATFDPVYF
jgi:heat shock protein HslJ